MVLVASANLSGIINLVRAGEIANTIPNVATLVAEIAITTFTACIWWDNRY